MYDAEQTGAASTQNGFFHGEYFLQAYGNVIVGLHVAVVAYVVFTRLSLKDGAHGVTKSIAVEGV